MINFDNVQPLAENRIALFDMDGTLVDFQGVLKAKLLEMKGPEEEFPEDLWTMPDHWYARAQAIKKIPGFWSNLPKLQWGWDVLKICEDIGFDIHILTKGPTTGPRAWMEKVEWVRRHLPDATLHITDDKRIAYGRVFVDDYWPFMEMWLRHRPRGLGVVNYPSHVHPNLINVHDGLENVREKLQEAFDRDPGVGYNGA